MYIALKVLQMELETTHNEIVEETDEVLSSIKTTPLSLKKSPKSLDFGIIMKLVFVHNFYYVNF